MTVSRHEPLRRDPAGEKGKIPVAVLGATGSVGQRFITLLSDHPWFEVAAIAASERSVGKPYAEAAGWVQSTPIPPSVARLILQPCRWPFTLPAHEEIRLVFSALDPSVAGAIETEFARAGCLVVSNARSHRMEADVPLLVPEVNGDHLALVERQSFGGGAIVTNPNCSTIGLVMALKPLHDAFGVASLHVVTLQAVSGAGLPGVASYEMLDNVIPWIESEEEKMESESRKILGRLTASGVEPADFTLSAQCNRVGVVDGHTICVSLGLRSAASMDEVRQAWEDFRAAPQELELPMAPRQPIHYRAEQTAPQPRLHRDLERGMATVIGRLRPCPLLDVRFVVLSHNTVRGAAGGALLGAELAVARGLLPTPSSSLGMAR